MVPGSLIWDDGRGAVTGFGVRFQRRDRVYLVKYTVDGKGRCTALAATVRHGPSKRPGRGPAGGWANSRKASIHRPPRRLRSGSASRH